jgi:predicted lipid carrier protein YhbT
MSRQRTGFTPQDLFKQAQAQIGPAVKKASQVVKPVERAAIGGAFALGFVPQKLQASALGPMLNHALMELIDHGDFDFLDGHCCAIAVKDSNLSWPISFENGKLSVEPGRAADVTIRATVPAFLNLISQQVDPDTLFFQRQLAIEGDVELGLYVKNMLDALDEDDLPMMYQKALQGLRVALELEAQ